MKSLVERDHEAIWSAHDDTLDRDVKVWIFDAEHPRLDRVVSAAQEVALISDPQLVRILDVQERDSDVVIVMEDPEDLTLDSILTAGPMPLPQVAHLANRVVMALSAGSSQKIFHQRLEPALIHVRPDNSVKVSQLGIRAAAEGFDRFSPSSAAKTDALGLCALVFAALVGRWHWRAPVSQFVSPMAEGEARNMLLQADSQLPAELVAFLEHNLSGYAEDGITPGDVLAVLEPYDSENLDYTPQPISMDRMPKPMAAPQRAAAAATTNGRGIRGLDPDTLLSFPAFNPQHDPELQEAIRVKEPAAVKRLMLMFGSVLAVAFVVAVVVVSGTVSSMFRVSPPPPLEAEPVADEPAVVDEPRQEEVVAEPAAPVVPIIAKAHSVDPQGDGKENNSMLPRLFDGSAKTVWRTDGYNSNRFGGLKDGVGVVLEFAEPVDINQIKLTALKGGGSIELRAASGPGAVDSTVLATGTWAGKEATFSPSSPIAAQKFVAIWITELPAHSRGKFRLDVAEVSVS